MCVREHVGEAAIQLKEHVKSNNEQQIFVKGMCMSSSI
jgi:hypothetical protein